MSITGLPQSAAILVATFGFAGLAWTTNEPREPDPQCDHVTVVQYLPLPMPTPILPPVQEIGWPVLERQRADDAPVVNEPQSAEPAPAPRHRYHRRWGRIWR